VSSVLSAPVAIALLSAALFGAATPASKWLLAELTALQLAGLLYLGAAVGVAPALVAQRALPLPRGRRGRWLLLGAIGFGGILGPVLLLLGLSLASAASVALWLNLELAATAVLGAWFFHDRLGASGWLGAVAAVGAGLLLSAGEGGVGLVAGGLVGAACVCWALDNHWTARLDALPPSATTFWKGIVAGTTNLALGCALAPFAASGTAVGLALGTGALSYGLSITLYVVAAQAIGATRAQVLFASAPLFGVGLAALWLGEPVTLVQGLAAAALAVSVALVMRDRHAHPHSHEALAHVHWHRHDDHHHGHVHEGGEERAEGAHSHWHVHEPVRHAHPHWPDLHHRHRHGEDE
jgi:drug/metabolite transporter (DMT)-like permease